MKCNQSRPGFELVSPCPFPTTITNTPWAPPSLYTNSNNPTLQFIPNYLPVFSFLFCTTLYLYLQINISSSFFSSCKIISFLLSPLKYLPYIYIYTLFFTYYPYIYLSFIYLFMQYIVVPVFTVHLARFMHKPKFLFSLQCMLVHSFWIWSIMLQKEWQGSNESGSLLQALSSLSPSQLHYKHCV